MTPSPPPRLALRGITKRYPGVVANDDVSLAVMPGEVHALLGENGAGKSTLMKVVYGLARPDAGDILWHGRPVAVASPAAARALGIGMVFQHFNLFDSLTVTENVALGLGVAGGRALAARIAATADRYGLAVHPQRHVHALSVGERQRVEIVRCLLQDAELLILDEPTSVLTPQESDRLFDTVARFAAEGRSVLFISHKLAEIRTHCDVATVLRGGRVVAACRPREETPARLAEMMVGRNVAAPTARAHATTPEPLFVVRGLSLPPDAPFGVALDAIGFALKGGEILGIAGVAGNGQTELLSALSGERTAAGADAVVIAGTPAGRLGAAARRRLGLAFVPEERIDRGAVAEMALADNMLLTAAGGGLVRWGIVRHAAVRRAAAAVIDRFGVVCRGPDAAARTLSGGNLQKFIVGREVAPSPRVLIAAHPTWGVDVAASAAIRQAILDLAAGGAAVVVVSEDLDELFEIAGRIAVLHRGRLSPPLSTATATIAEIGLLMGGHDDAADADAA
ncbi:MAG: ABC transporter ATP-binding protein [Rhodospirillales bacterium]